MKILAVCLISLLSLSALAQTTNSTGSMHLDISPDFGTSGDIHVDADQKGTVITGRNSSGSFGDINLQVANGLYQGLTGGSQLTSLNCSAVECSGFIAGGSSELKISEDGDLQGNVNENVASLTRTKAGDIIINTGVGSMNLHLTGVGQYEGEGSFDGASTFHVTLKTSGTFLGMKDPGLAAIFLMAPVSGANH